MDIETIARIAHQLNKAYCESIGDNSQPNWKDAPDWQKKSAINGVIFHQKNPGFSARASHENWLKEKFSNGWKYGPTKNQEKKEHPCCVDYNELPQEQKSKDYIFKSIVEELSKI